MKFFTALVSLGLAAVAAAQSIAIGAPADGTSVSAGQSLTVQVERPDSLTGSTEVAIVISVAPCSSSNIESCPDPSGRLGSTLYSGSFDPEFPTSSPGSTANGYNGPQQNYTVIIPSNGLTSGNLALLSVVHLSLVGAGPYPLYEIKNVTLNIN
ncbi:uncharacterized protein STEHIDRAFT_126517 [Stereum hirsutum FP-91666 SS1]|uniref:Phosphatidylglycerol/phosphatidylinositol transfer protein n=1 Tax=Stereum hirsutum (strain FP-91666) TaxID=721885 RepID=R7RVY1_STEHR|nr:uncharacterized protein STEHIDRAFT_126517 [Stereum hirsutum FP-91666 SS1]EIM79421.1 hypothetical protein STEHIDRAFT_126517 [Stereum hirsutum FP-91666 SS1]